MKIVIPCFKFSPEIRKAVYTANAIEPVNYTIGKVQFNEA
jgi:transposase-like protein